MLTSKPFGVNIMLMSPFVEGVVEVVTQESVPIVTTGGGNPGAHILKLKQAEIKVMPVVASLALAKRLERLKVDAIIAEGMESGGHVGETTTMALIPQMVDGVGIPVIAAGGIADGRGLAAALALGAQGIQMGTRFVCAEECIAHPKFKQKILGTNDHATVVTGQSLGHPVRCLKNKMTQQFLRREQAGALREELEQMGRGKFYAGVIEGDVDNSSLMAGQIAGLIKEIKPAKEILEEIIAEAEATISHLTTILLVSKTIL
jgi:enoyl-[acyl-carrier protein] reductase II